MPKNKLKWRKDGTAKCGIFEMYVWPYKTWDNKNIRYGWTVHYPDVNEDKLPGINGHTNDDKAKSAAESWLSRQVEKMRKDLKQ